ncbi:MAG: site-specific DNA-methyltransferase [Anaerolineae bacterium]|nr:site-specific DNA-methyltransferase [Anaerolineae bacterium]MDW8172279.1 site-specific DNA-methyltransferase [Anaerolineae bacterium]
MPDSQPKSAQKTPFFSAQNLQIYHDDFLTSDVLPDESVDLIVTSPPYNVGIGYSTHDDAHEYRDYLALSEAWLKQAYRVSRPDGRLCVNIPLDKNKGGQQSVCADVTSIAKAIGWQYHSTIIWNEGNISRRTAWGSWMSASAPYVIAPVEVIVVLYKQHWKKRQPGMSDITRDEFMAWTNGLWTFNGESKKRVGHPAPFPRELPRRCIRLFSYVGDVILDPFMGSGTTLLEAWDNKRTGIGFDIAQEYCELAQKRLESLWQQPRLI